MPEQILSMPGDPFLLSTGFLPKQFWISLVKFHLEYANRPMVKKHAYYANEEGFPKSSLES
jgi:hypothetical protein